MKVRRMEKSWEITLTIVMTVFCTFAEAEAGSLVELSRSSAGVSVAAPASSSTTRLTSYISAIKTIAPEIEPDSFEIVDEFAAPNIGRFVLLLDSYYGIPVSNSLVSLWINTYNEAVYLKSHWYAGFDLTYESFLDNRLDSTALDSTIRNFFPDLDTLKLFDDIVPRIRPLVDSVTQVVTYTYALNVPGLGVVDWNTGDVIRRVHRMGGTVHVHGYVRYLPITQNDAPVTEQLYNIGIAWTKTANGSQVIDGPCVLPAQGQGGCPLETGEAQLLRVHIEAGNPYYNVFSHGIYHDGFDWNYYEATTTYDDFDLVENWSDFSHWAFFYENTNNATSFAEPTVLHHVYRPSQWFADHFGGINPDHSDHICVEHELMWDGETVPESAYTIPNLDILDPNPQVVYGVNSAGQWGALNRDIIVHEYGHVWQARFYEDGMDSNPNDPEIAQQSAAQEATADFSAACFAESDILQGGTFNWDIARSQGQGYYSWDDFDPEVDEHWNGHILSGALWDALTRVRDSVCIGQSIPSQFGSPYEYFLWLLSFAYNDGATVFGMWPTSIVKADDAAHQLPVEAVDGSPNGWAIYESFKQRGIIPNLTGDVFDVYERGDMAYPVVNCALTTSSLSKMPNSSARRIARSSFGSHTIHHTDNDMYLCSSYDGGLTHPGWLLTPDLSNAGNHFPSLDAIEHFANNVQNRNVYGAYKRGIDKIDVWKLPLSSDICEQLARKVAQLTIPETAVATAPVLIGRSKIPLVFAGTTQGSELGVHYWQCDDEFLEGSWTHARIPGTENHAVTSLAAYMMKRGVNPIVAWIAGNQVYFCHANRLPGDILEWNDAEVVSLGIPGDNKSDVSICFSGELQGVFVVWEATDPATGDRNIYVRQASGFDPSGPLNWAWPVTVFSLDGCGNLESPSLAPFSDIFGVHIDGASRVGLAYTSSLDLDATPRIKFNGLRVDDSQPTDASEWQWMGAIDAGIGVNPSLSPWNGTGYDLSYTSSAGEAPHQIRYGSPMITYDFPDPPTYPPDVPISSTEEITTPVAVANPLVVINGGHLIILPNPSNECGPNTISFYPGGKIIVEEGGTLSIQGTEEKPIKFQSYDSTKTWGGIKVEGGTLNMDYAEMKDCDTVCVWTYKPEQVSITNCVLHGDKMVSGSSILRLYGNPEKSQYVANTQIMNAPYATGLNAKGCDVTFDNVEIKNCYANSYVSSVTGNFRDCAFGGRTIKHGVMFLSAGNTPNFQCCQFEDLSPLGGSYQSSIYAMDGSAPSFGYVGLTQGASNTVSDSSAALLKMFGSGVLPIIANGSSSGPGGKNDWYQRKSSGYNLYWGSPYPKPLKQYYAKQQYWDPAPATLSDFYPSDASYFEYSSSPANPWELCGDATSSVSDRGAPYESGLDDADPVYDSLFALAMSHEILREFALSQPIFRTIVREEDDYYLSWLAMTHAASNQRFLQDSVDGSWIVPMIDSLVGVAPDSMVYDAAVAGGRLKANFYVSIYEHEAAIDELADLIESGLTERDSLLVSLELLDAYVAAGLIEDDGSLDGTNSIRVPSRLRVKSDAEAWVIEHKIVERLGQIMDSDEPGHSVPLPAEFRLYQNYPNPFNPTTQIEFDLPQGAPVTLKVFNTLGQEVTTLLDATRPAGHHVVMWNGKNSMGEDVATGLYVYQIQAGGFSDTKKMVLLR